MDWNVEVISQGWDGPSYRVQTPWFEVVFLVGIDDDLAEVANVDVEVSLADGSRWCATLFTLTEVERLMSRWARTGEALDGSYFWCIYSVIVREPGVHNMTEVLAGLHHEGDLQHILKRVDDK